MLERVGGAPFAELFSREIWSRIGAEHDAAIMLDHAGFAIVEGGICTTLRDLARFGQMCLDDGRGPDGEVVPATWVARVLQPERRAGRGLPRPRRRPIRRRPTPSTTTAGGSATRARGIYAALGMNGQSIFLHRPSRTVIAKFSTFPDALDDRLFALHHAGMLAVCEHLA